jgi:preprotein translocase subunit SecD
MNQYPLWKTVVLIVATLLGALYAAPNLFGEDPAVQISTVSGDPLPADTADRIGKALAAVQITPRASEAQDKEWIVRLPTAETQLKAADTLKQELGTGYIIALNLASKTPHWLSVIGARPMALGLDLRGGVHFLLEVDIDDARKAAVQRYLTDLPTFLRGKDIRYTGRRQDGDGVVLEFADAAKLQAARDAIAKDYRELTLTEVTGAPTPTLRAVLSDVEAKRIVDNAVQQNLITLRNRVNQLGVAEPVVQRQGSNRILVQLPGVQDTARVKDLLGATATLEYRAVEGDLGEAAQAASSGIVPPGDDLFFTREGHRPVLLKKEVIASGPELVDAASTIDENGQPAVSVTLSGSGAKRMFDFTSKNVGKPMAVLYKEVEIKTSYNAQGQPLRERRDITDIISVATIRGVFGKNFQTTGLTSKEAHDLSLLLKAGALAAPVEIIEERTVGPSLGADNIRRGFQAAMLGLGLVIAFMVFYYRVFGLFAIAALMLNLVIVVAGLSILQATLTMPGIAGLVLTMGIAVDANVLIYERIREELRNGNSPQASILAGYDRAFLTIADANVTVLIGTLVLFFLGSGPVKGFAITLALGIITSQFTAIVGTRSLAHAVFGKRRMKDLPIW